MLVVGGTADSQSLLDPKQLPENEVVWSFYLDSCNWFSRGKCNSASDPVPWNLVNCSLFRLDPQSVCVLWYDTFKEERRLAATVYNFVENTWKLISLATPSISGIEYRLG
jgi:hypothetical protein